MKKLLLSLVLSMLCFMNPIGNSVFAGESVIDWEEDDGSCDSGGNEEVKVGWYRKVFLLELVTEGETEVTVTGVKLRFKAENIVLSCCVMAKDNPGRLSCDFSEDSADCGKFVDRVKGKLLPIHKKLY